jgi:hypothetical protein
MENNDDFLIKLFVTEDGHLAIHSKVDDPVKILGFLDVVKNDIINSISVANETPQTGDVVNKSSKYEA